ncbi:hypothetical protein [Mesorhizobium sp.]|uniref:hypothetical protein n=1 Tax=Mesorhizobium sp. TaxID=1871066 RepID=UPI0011FD993D|nr:hypothetical protein [Mesorhizobium sp.]TIO79417.1 MAG: hypothetical protein E5X75_02350 [Mesorhizobium sp.]
MNEIDAMNDGVADLLFDIKQEDEKRRRTGNHEYIRVALSESMKADGLSDAEVERFLRSCGLGTPAVTPTPPMTL